MRTATGYEVTFWFYDALIEALAIPAVSCNTAIKKK
jgi:hypothetical protein